MSSRVKRRPGRPEASAPGRPEASARPNARPSEWALLRSVVYYRACAQLERHPTLWRIVLLGLGLGLLLALGVRSHQSAVCRTATIEPHDHALSCHSPALANPSMALCSSTPARAVCSPPLPVHTQCSRSARALHAQCTCPQHEATHKWRNTPAVRVAHHPFRTATRTAHARPRRVARPAPQEPGRRGARSRDEAPVRRAAGSHLSAAEAQVAAAGAALQAQTPRQQAEAAKKTFSLLTYSASEVQPGEPEASPSPSPSPAAEGCSPCPS